MPKVEDMPSIAIHSAAASPNAEYTRWKVHGDCVTQLTYYDSINAVISSSNHEPTALVIGFAMGATNVKKKLEEIRNVGKTVKKGESSASLAVPRRRAECHHTVFSIHKGVKAFSFCREKNLLVTAGMDRLVRVWNPYLPGKPTGVLRGHMAPVVYVHISLEESKVFSMSTDNTVKIWDLETHGCCFTASSKASGIKGELSACLYLPGPRTLCVATDALAFLHLKVGSVPEPHLVHSHQEPVVCCRYNPAFRHVVSCCEASVVKVWDFDTGRQVSEFIGCHGDASVTCLTFDSSGRSYDGEIIVWNVVSGHMYCKLNPPSPVDGQDHREGSVTFWKLFSGAGLIANFTPSKGKAQVSSIVVTSGDTLTYLADQQGFVHVYDIQEYGLRGPELQAPKTVTSWRAHISMVTSLELIEDDSILLSSSLDRTVRLWSKDGAYIGTFGQSRPWDVFTPASWSHPRVPFEILTDPQSMPTHPVLETDIPTGCLGGQQERDIVMEEKVLSETAKTQNLPSPGGPTGEAEAKEDKSPWSAFCHGRLRPAQRKPRWKVPELKWPSIYQALQCHEVPCVSALGEKPDLSLIGSDMFTRPGERSRAAGKEGTLSLGQILD
ncbi:hypothetical protein ACRRTK_008260 [Alexandromys fortis]